MCRIGSLEELWEMKIPIYKSVYLTQRPGKIIQEIWKEMEKIPGNRGCISFFNNLELTDEKAQKGHAISRYMEKLGYRKEEVMVLGDSLK